ncbi:right-handed parallel beta-helix repeat-containing protein [bacterium]|nr:right-handed parallel beta-helix repeat-containing protein [bacterium]
MRTPIFVLSLLCLCPTLCHAQASYEAWLKHRDQVRPDPSVQAYYTFEDLAADAKTIPNERGASYPLAFNLVPHGNDPAQKLEFVPGRWPEKKAVRLDMGRLEGAEIPVQDRCFTASCWFRSSGPGVHKGNSNSNNGTILSVGIGYWDGWRVTLWYPDMRVGFEVGRPQPGSSFGINGVPFMDHVWNHVAATWDGKQTRLYLNGLLIARGDYAGAYTPPPGQKVFRIGFADSGIGSAILDVDEVTIRSRALSPVEVLQEVYFADALPQTAQAALSAAEEAVAAGDYATALAGYRALGSDKTLPASWQPFVALRLGLLYQQGRQPAAAAREFARIATAANMPETVMTTALTSLLKLSREGVPMQLPPKLYAALLNMPGITPGDQFTVHLQLGHALRRQGQAKEAAAEYASAFALQVAPRTKLNARLGLAHACRADGDTDLARSQYLQVLSAPDATSEFRVAALFGIAECHATQKKWDQAAAALERAAALTDAPAHLRAEARERQAEIACRKANKPLPSRADHVKLPTLPRPAVELHVAPNGSDANPGTLRQPLATLQGAQAALRKARTAGAGGTPALNRGGGTAPGAGTAAPNQGGVPPQAAGTAPGAGGTPALNQNGGTPPSLPAGGAVVYVHGGTYPCAAALVLTAEDTGTPQAPIVYRNYRDEKPRFTGGVAVKGLVPVTDPTVLARLPEEARGKVVQADLRAQGIADLGKMSKRGMDAGTAPYTEVFWNGEPLRLGRWPNEGYVRVGPIASGGEGGKPTTFGYDYDRANRWLSAPDPYAEGFWRFDWAEGSLAINKIDDANRQFTIDSPGGYGLRAGQRYFVLNLLEEIDQPGEMYLDRATGLLYVYPPSSPVGQAASPARAGEAARATGGGADRATEPVVEFSLLEQPFVEMTDCSWTVLQGLTFDICRGNAVAMKNGEHNLIAGCTITRPGQTGVIVDGGHDCGIFGCDIGWTGRGCTVVTGGDRKTLEPGRHFVENCDLHDFSRIERSYTPAVLLNGVGNRIAHNLMHESPHHAMRIEGNDHVIEFNEIHSVVTEGDDQSGLDIYGNPGYWGNVFRYNFWHHIGSGVACGQGGIRLDDAISGVLMYGNIFYKCSESNFGGIQIHGGKDNIVDNNVFVDCKYGLSFSAWGQERWEKTLDTWGKQKLDEVNAFQPPYSERYPQLLRIREHADINMVWRNVAVNCGSFMTRDGGRELTMDNLVLAQDPGFVKPDGLNFGLQPTSAVFAGSTFRRIPVEEIGLYRHPLRASWPVKNEVSPNFKPLPN